MSKKHTPSHNPFAQADTTSWAARRQKSALFRHALHKSGVGAGLEEDTEPDPHCHHAMIETLGELETQEKAVLSLYHMESFGDDEIGEVFGWREERAQWQRHRVMSKVRRGWALRLALEPQGGDR